MNNSMISTVDDTVNVTDSLLQQMSVRNKG